MLKVTGFNDEVTVCDRCGREELRGTVIVGDADSVEVGRYGTTCAGYVVGRKITRAGAVEVESSRRADARYIVRAVREAREAGNVQGWRVLLNDFARIAWREDEREWLDKQRAEFVPAWREFCAQTM